jgi:hypothetical protein
VNAGSHPFVSFVSRKVFLLRLPFLCRAVFVPRGPVCTGKFFYNTQRQYNTTDAAFQVEIARKREDLQKINIYAKC